MEFLVRPEGQELPKLFRFRNEEFVNSGFPHLGLILDIAAAANDLPTFVERVVVHLIGVISEDDLLHHSEAPALETLTLPELSTLKP